MEQWHAVLLTRARERRLEKVAAAYAVTGWLAVQIAAIAFPAFQAPDWLLRWLIAATLLGFPAALTAAWIWNRERSEAVARLSRLDVALLGTIGAIAVLTLGELAWHWSSEAPATSDVAAQEAAEGSIAVLPFANTSGDPKQRYFGEGLSDELIGLLARNSALRVAARTSSYSFEGKNEDIRAIAEKLNVRAVLEGNVRTEGDRVRIEADLINASDGYEVWSQSYDRSLSDILLVQADIAQAIASALLPKLLKGRDGVPQAHAIDPRAYQLYLEGLVDMNQRRPDTEKAALPLLREAVRLAPDFAAAQATLAYDSNFVAWTNDQYGPSPERDAALAKALSLDPTNPLALSLAIQLDIWRRNWDGAIDKALTLKRSNIHSVDALRGVSAVYDEFGLNSLPLWLEAVRLDPLSFNAQMNLADAYFLHSRPREAIETVKDALKLSPGNPMATAQLCGMLASVKRITEAKAIRESMILSGASQDDLTDCKIQMARATGDSAMVRRSCDDNVAHFPKNGLSEIDLGYCFALTGDMDRALDWFERALDKGQDVFALQFDTTFPPVLFQNRRWISLTRMPAFQLWSQARARSAREFGGN